MAAKKKLAAKRVGRPPTGKRSNPDYSQHSVWLPRVLYGDVQRKLIAKDGTRKEFSDLVQELLRKWLGHGSK